MGQYQYRGTSTTMHDDGTATVTKRKGRRLWMEPELSDAQWKQLATEISTEIRDALVARDPIIGEGQLVDYCDWLYEQGKTPADQQKPWGADLNSYLVTEAVDSLFARLVQAAFPKQEVVCTVGGWGEDSKKKAPVVEEFLDFKFRQDETDAQYSTAMAIFQNMLEDAGILEVTEGYEVRSHVEEIDIQPETDADGGWILDAKNLPTPKLDPTTGEPIRQTDPQGAAIKAKYRQVKPKLTGPKYDVISTRDFVWLPVHAKNRAGAYGYAKRCFPRYASLKEQAQRGIYRDDKVTELGSTPDRQVTASQAAQGLDIAAQTDDTAEKELWEFYIKRDLDGDGYEEYYCGTLSIINDVMIRLVLDDFGRERCLMVNMFPRRDSIWGYNFTASKMASIAEEHASLRNTATDRSTLASNPPLMQIAGGMWDPNVQPFGTGQVITVQSKDEVTPMVIPDVPQSNYDLRRECLAAKERVTGVNDVSGSSVSNTQPGTATRDALIAQAGAVRVEAALSFLREFLAELWEVRRLIYVRMLESEQDGIDMPDGLIERLAFKGVENNGKITADDLKGHFYMKPVGSVASANPQVRAQQSMQSFISLANLAKVSQPIAMALATPEAALAIAQTWARDADVVDKNALIAPLRQMVQAKAAMEEQQRKLSMLGGMVPGGMPAPQPGMGGAPLDLMSLFGGGQPTNGEVIQ